MKYAILLIVSAPISLYALWLYYLAVMALKRANDVRALAGFVRYAALTIKYPGLLLDVFCNIVWMTILFRELPREWLVTDRVSRKKKEEDRIATWMCETLLDDFDPSGCHCR
jgi:hypothetical protein